MVSELYQKTILALAASAHAAGRLKSPQATARIRNPLCGDEVIIDLVVHNDKVAAMAHELKACVICQASASVLGKHAIGAQRADLEKLAHTLETMLTAEGAGGPNGRWRDYRSFAPVAEHRNRHGCVLLPVRALLTAWGRLEGESTRPGTSTGGT